MALLCATPVHTGCGDSDKATTILVPGAIGGGHLLLHGRILSPGGYRTRDPFSCALQLRPGGRCFHVAAALCALAGLGALRRGRLGRGWALALAQFAPGIPGEPMIVEFRAAPQSVAGLAGMLRK
ncbi:MAG: hypothetical protein ACLQCU_00095 [Acidimicrobiales bacterium]